MVHFIPSKQRKLAMLAAQADNAPVLICGADGTGKGSIARWIHRNGPRAALKFVSSDHSSPLADQIVEAQGGSFLVSEVGEYPLADQKMLLEFLNTKSVPHGNNGDVRMLLNIRIICTTSQTLEGRAQGGMFDPELLKKLNVFRIEMPELEKRKDEFDEIAQGILEEITRELHKEFVKEISPEVWAKFHGYHWPGNLRELRNVLRISVMNATSRQIKLDDLPEFGHDRIDFRATREQFEKLYILELLKTFNWEIDKTCQISNLDKEVLLSKMKRFGIDLASAKSIP